MNHEFLDIILALGAVVAASGVAVIWSVGLVVWLAGGRREPGKDREAF